jgi:hypothetical protein
MHANDNDRDDTRAIATGLARWYREAMTDCEQAAFHDTPLADELRRAGHSLQPPAAHRDEPEGDRRHAVSLTA